MNTSRCLAYSVTAVLLLGCCGTAAATPEAFVAITPTADLNGSTFATGSFVLRNASSAGERIVRFRLDLRSAVLQDLVFDPAGVAGDPVGKCFTPIGTEATATGLTHYADKCTDPFQSPHDGGFDVIEITFNDFDPGEQLSFSVDNDPTSVKGSTPGNAEPAASISGLELTASTVTVEFSNGTIVQTTPFRTPASDGGSQNVIRSGGPAAPGVEVLGVPASPFFVTDATQTVRVSGAPGASVRLLVLEALFDPGDAPGGGFDVDPFEANSVSMVREFSATVRAGGTIDFPITLTKSQPNAGYNHIVAAFSEADGRTSPTSEVVVLQLGQACSTPALILPDTSCQAGVPCEIAIGLASGTNEVASLAGTLTSSAGISCESACQSGAQAPNGSCSVNPGTCSFNVADLAAPITGFSDGDVARLSVTCTTAGVHALGISDVSMGTPAGGPVSGPCGQGSTLTCIGETGDVAIDTGSTVSVCESGAGNAVTIPGYEVADLPNSILVVTVGAEEDNGDCDLGLPGAQATYAGQVLMRAVSSISDSNSWRACNAIFYLLDPPAGIGDIVITLAETVGTPINNRQAGAFVIYNAAQHGPDAIATGGGDPTANPLITAIAPAAADALVVDIATWGNTGSQVAMAGQAKRWGQSCGSSSSAASTKLAPAGATTLGWTHSNANRAAHALAAFAPAEMSIAICGDGTLDAGEQCDDGNLADGDGCDSNCTLTACGNGIATVGEQCDDGNLIAGDGCDGSCESEFCGDGVLQTGLGEQCDNGALNSNSTPDACRTDCSAPSCGDGVADAGEQCDDGNLADGDGCTGGCVVEFCGDGALQATLGEQCDDGNQIGGDCCSATCQAEAGCAPAPVEIDQASITSTCQGLPGDSLSLPVTVAAQANRMLVVTVGAEENDGDCDLSLATVSYAGIPMIEAASAVSDVSAWRTCNGIFYLTAPPTGTANVEISFPTGTASAVNNRHAAALVLHNAAQTAPEATMTAGADPTANPVVTPIATLSPEALLIDTVAHGNTGTETAAAGQTTIATGSCDSSSSGTSIKLMTAAGATTMGWTHSNANRASHVIAAFAAATGGVPATTTTTTTTTSTTTTVLATTTTTLPGCVADADCDDGKACTIDLCAAGACQHTNSCAAGNVGVDAASLTSTCAGNAADTLSFPVSVGTQNDRVLVVAVGAEENDADCDLAAATVSYGGVPMVAAVSAKSDASSWRTCNGIFYLSSPPAGTASVEIAFPAVTSSAINNRHAGAVVLYDADQSGPEVVMAGGGDPTANPIATAFATMSPLALALDIVTHGNTGVHTAGAGQTLRWTQSCTSSASASSTMEVAAAGPASMGWSHSSPNRAAHSIAAWAPAASQCGNGSLDAGEACDDANLISGDGCDANCTITACGNGVVTAPEQCDDGNLASGDGCDSSCGLEFCGDGVVQATLGEQCDDGGANSDVAADACRTNCLAAGCGDAVVDAGEACDDGNLISGDGCSAACMTELCGDGTTQPGLGEQCDDGNSVAGDGCTPACLDEFCGDGTVQGALGEQCDDGNSVAGDGCSSTCSFEICGDGVLQPSLGEQCDDGNTSGGDCCDASCQTENTPACQPGGAEMAVDTGSLLSTCESGVGDVVTVASVTVGSQPGRILVATVGAEENNADCDLSLAGATAFYGDIELTRAVAALSDEVSFRTCNGIFYLLNPPSTTADVRIELPSNDGNLINNRQAGAFVIYNAAQLPPEAVTSAGADPSLAVVTTSIVGMTPGALAVDVITQGNTGGFAAGTAGQDIMWQRSCGSSSSATSTEFLGAPGPASMSWSHSRPNRHAHALAVFTPADYPCAVDADCDDGNFCTVDTCNGERCLNNPLPANGSACDDGVGCSSADVCSNGNCVGQDTCGVADFCNLATATCDASVTEAYLAITPEGPLSESVFGAGSFILSNRSGGGHQITRLRIDVSSGLLHDIIFDPVGAGGDVVAKCFTPGPEKAAVGWVGVADKCVSPFQVPHDGGYDVLEISFADFDPTETFTFSVDIDSSTVQGSAGNSPGGAISGFELMGAYVEVEFDDGSIHTGNQFRVPGVDGGSQNTYKASAPTKPGIEVLGVVSPPATVTSPSQTVRITGPAGAKVRLIIAEGGLFAGSVPVFDPDPFEDNDIVAIQELAATVGAGGSVDIPVVMTNSGSAAGINHIVAAFEDATGRTGATSDKIVLGLN